MAVNEIQGSLVLTEISEDNITWKVLVCGQDAKFDITTNVTVEKTQCGPIKAVDAPDWKFSGGGVANSSPTSDQVSFADLVGYQAEQQLIYVRRQSPANDTLGLEIGEAFYQGGEGYVTSVSGDTSNGAVVKFTYNIDGQGDLVRTKPALTATAAPATVNITAPAALNLTSSIAGGSGPFTYQWKKGGTNISGATSSTYTKGTTVAGTDSGSYTVEVTDDEGTIDVSNACTVTVA